MRADMEYDNVAEAQQHLDEAMGAIVKLDFFVDKNKSALPPGVPQITETASKALLALNPAIASVLSDIRERDTEPLNALMKPIEALPRDDRAMLRPWMLAHYDEDGSERPAAPRK